MNDSELAQAAAMLAAPQQFIQRKFKTKQVFLGDDEGIFFRYQTVGWNVESVNWSCFIQSIWCYKVRM